MYIKFIQKILPVANDLESHIAINYIISVLALFSRSYLEHFERKKTRKIRYTVNKIRSGMKLDRIQQFA